MLPTPALPRARPPPTTPAHPQAPDVLHAALREAELSPKGGITLLEFRRFLAAQLQDGLDLFDPRLGLPEAGYFADSEVDYSSDEYI